MKINKILAAGVAATLAVTSLSAVASAEPHQLKWSMEYTFSSVKWNGQRMQWLDDNDYITSGIGSYQIAATNLETAIGVAATSGILKDVDTTGCKNDADAATALDGTKVLLTDFISSCGAKAKAYVKNEADITKALDNAYKYLGAAKTAATAGKTINATQVQNNNEAVGSVNSAINEYKKAIAQLDIALDAIKAGADSTDADKKTAEKIIGNMKTAITGFISSCATAVNKWTADVNGPQLLAETEVGGIYLKKAAVPVVMGDGLTYYAKPTAAKLTIKGTKAGSTANESYSTDFKQAYKTYDKDTLRGVDKDDDYLFVAFAPKYVNREGFVNLNVFGTITDASIDVDYTLYDDAECKIETKKYREELYNNVKKVSLITLRNGLDIDYLDENVANADAVDTWIPATTSDGKTNDLVKTVAALTDKSTALYKLFYGLDKSVVYGDATENSNSKKTLKPFLARTTAAEGATIYRYNVERLSDTDAWNSDTVGDRFDANQTYHTTLNGDEGTNPTWFAGLASQCADFFHKQNNGTITFVFEDPATADLWVSYGVPSTEVGLRTLQGTAMALFFNYKHTSGSIQTIGVVDADAWTITFDMATVLDDFSYSTKGTLADIFYGLNTGLKYGSDYNNAVGYVVKEVLLSYDDAPAAVDATTDDDAAVVVADDDDDVVADDDDDDIFADDDVVADDDDDDDDAGIIEDDDDDDTDVNNDVDYVDGADDDANPGTGVGLAVIPAIVAAAAAVVSKKRK